MQDELMEAQRMWMRSKEKKCYIMKIDADIQLGFSLDGLEENVHLIIH